MNKILQLADISIVEEVKHLDSLRKDIQTIRDFWDSICREAKLVASALGQNTELKVKSSGRLRRMFPDEPTKTQHVHDSQENVNREIQGSK